MLVVALAQLVHEHIDVHRHPATLLEVVEDAHHAQQGFSGTEFAGHDIDGHSSAQV